MIVHLNGSLVPAEKASISPFDRGFLFGDGIYEGLRAGRVGGTRRVIGLSRHIRRMTNGLKQITVDWRPDELGRMTDELLDANGLSEAFIYWQVTRGTPDLAKDPVRSRVPPTRIRPTVFGYCAPLASLDSLSGPSVKAATVCYDSRWEHGHIKSISLLANIMESMAAAGAGSDEAILVRREAETALVTEGTYTNVVVAALRPTIARELPAPFDMYDVTTPSLSSAPLLPGVTREIVLDLEKHIREHAVESRALFEASEIILLGTTTMVASVHRLNGEPVGDGEPGPVARYLFDRLMGAIRAGMDDAPAQRIVRERVGPETVGAI